MRLVSLVSAASFFSLPCATRANGGDDPLISKFPSLVEWFRKQGGTSESFPPFFAVHCSLGIPIRDKYRC